MDIKKIVIAPDSFKGSLDAKEICGICKESIGRFFPDCEVVTTPIADGGEGSVDSLLLALPGEKVYVDVHGPFMEPVRAFYGRFGDTAVIEMAQAAGLPMVEGKANPSKTTTYGVGELMKHAVEHGAKKVIAALGGSATNDGACGMAAAMGVKFTNAKGEEFVPVGGTLGEIVGIDNSAAMKLIEGVEVLAMCDIDNPMFGKRGAAYIFAPQKGADEEMVEYLDGQLRALNRAIEADLGVSVADIPGSGAAGAMGAGVMAFFGGKLNSGIDTVLDIVGFDKLLRGADMVITGEGRIDSQSVGGKAISGIAKRAAAAGVPVYVFAGQIKDDAYAIYDCGVTAMFSINRKAETFEMSRDHSGENLRLTFEDFLRILKAV